MFLSFKIADMKKTLKFLGLALLGLLVILTIAMFIMGKEYHFEKSIVINATPEKVYQHINSSKKFNQWNPWMDSDPNIKVTYSGQEGQVGDTYCWIGNDEVGEGCHEFLELTPNKGQKTKMTFKKPFESVGYSDVKLTTEGSGTKVTWTLDCDLDYPMNLMKIMMDSGMNDSYGKGLDKLKKIVEQTP